MDVTSGIEAQPAATPAEGNPALRFAGAAVAWAFRIVPERHRFAVALRAARCLEPVVRRTSAYVERLKLRTDNLREISLDLLLLMLTRHGTTFTPRLEVQPAAHLPKPGTGPILVVSPHTMLSMLFLRYLEDRGYEPFVIAAYPGLRTPGTRLAARVLDPSAALLFEARRCFKRGCTLTAMIDRGEPERRSTSFETDSGPLFVSDALVQLALRHNVAIVFLATTMDHRSRVTSWLSSPSGKSRTAGQVVAEFVTFVNQIHDSRTTPATPGARTRDCRPVEGRSPRAR